MVKSGRRSICQMRCTCSVRIFLSPSASVHCHSPMVSIIFLVVSAGDVPLTSVILYSISSSTSSIVGWTASLRRFLDRFLACLTPLCFGVAEPFALRGPRGRRLAPTGSARGSGATSSWARAFGGVVDALVELGRLRTATAEEGRAHDHATATPRMRSRSRQECIWPGTPLSRRSCAARDTSGPVIGNRNRLNPPVTHRGISIAVRRDDLAPSAGSHEPPGLQADRVLDEMDRAVHERDVDAAGVIAGRTHAAVTLAAAKCVAGGMC